MIRRSTWITLAIFGLVLATAVVIQQTQQRQAAQATPTAGLEVLFEVEGSDIIALRITSAEGDVVAVQRAEGGEWTLSEPENAPADQDRVGSAITQAESLRVLSTLEEEPDAGVIGLEPPQYQVTITLGDGGRQTALVGSETPTGSGYYARLQDGPLRVVNKSSLDLLLELLTDPPVAATASPEAGVTETVEP